MAITPEELDLSEIVGFIWSTTLELSVEPLDNWPATSASEPAMEAQVHIAGDWQGAVVLHAAPSLVASVARRMFSLGDRPPTLDDMQDAFGEVANITGGNLKGLMSDGGAHLSLPTVVQGHDYSVTIPGSHEIARRAFLCEGLPLVVTILRADAAGEDRRAKTMTAGDSIAARRPS